MKIRAILDEKYYEDIQLVKAYVGVLDSLQHVSRAIKTLNELLPVPSLQHLKRVKRCEDRAYILLDLVPETDEEEAAAEAPSKKSKLEEESIMLMLKEKGFSPKEYEMVGVEIQEVPAASPSARVQFEKSNKYWPVYFYPERNVENLMSESIFESEEEAYHISNMRWVTNEAVRTNKNVALIVDFENRQWLAKGVDRIEIHPLQHAVMVAVDAVAGTHEGGGAWDLPLNEITFVEKSEPQIVEDDDVPEDEEEEAPYLCTGYDLYVYKEPCVMCAMCLVHSRIKRIFFRSQNSNQGALASKCQIHSIRDLNHHYSVFQVCD